MNPDPLTLLAQHRVTYFGHSGASSSSPDTLPGLVAGPYQLPATFAGVMLMAALVLVVFMRPGTMARIVVSVPFSLFILVIAAIPLEAATGLRLIDFSMAEATSPAVSTLRLAAELICFVAAWKCIPWLFVGKEAFINFIVKLLTRR